MSILTAKEQIIFYICNFLGDYFTYNPKTHYLISILFYKSRTLFGRFLILSISSHSKSTIICCLLKLFAYLCIQKKTMKRLLYGK